MTRWIATTVSLLALSLPLAALAGDTNAQTPALEALLAASADVPAEHRALADYYRAQAAAERARAQRLRSAARHLTGGKLFQVSALRSHRVSQAEMLEASALEHEQLAEQHAGLAG